MILEAGYGDELLKYVDHSSATKRDGRVREVDAERGSMWILLEKSVEWLERGKSDGKSTPGYIRG